ncbi:trypsin-like serine protease [Rhizobium laguerreae]|uniref:trypsin-like serine peptidase n=1 Tax=Rhizobium laguerreae TaxID=1076926 RepID=UPI001C90F2D2|nr:trypsin-like serine protease [Rhizobium laguerreae]MBY3465686.1 trypsin-like serine protease [Rhizobium laguerreae]
MLATFVAVTFQSQPVVANENVVGRSAVAPEAAASVEEGIARDRQLTGPGQLPAKTRSMLGLPNTLVGSEARGSGGHPFTTQRASRPDGIEPVNSYPWHAVGKLFMKFGSQPSVCTASVIGKSLLVTAAHCVHIYGTRDQGFAASISFQPARHEGQKPYGIWTAKEWWIPKVYHEGTDVCLPEAQGVVCANDVAVIVLNENNGKPISDVTGVLNLPPANPDTDKEDAYGYVFFLGQNSTQLTQLGYPSKDFDGVTMIRTDSLGYFEDPNNVIIGSNQTGGSSGGPWLQNFGTPTSASGPAPLDDQLNTVSAVTSWGFTNGTVKVQGASRFSRNQIYTEKTNIRSLVDSACKANPTAC